MSISNSLMNSLTSLKVKVLCWNVLADCYSVGQTTKNLEILKWTFRWEKIKQMIVSAQADVVCLQEVDHYNDFYKPFFEEIGMQSIYMPRPKREDGCLIAYNSLKFTCDDHEGVQFDDLANQMGSSSYYDRFLRHNVAITARFSSLINPEKQFIVTCGHIYWNPSRPEIKLAQTVYWLDCLRKYAWYSKTSNNFGLLPTIVAGDFNSIPDSEPHRYLRDGVQIFGDSSSNCLDYIRSSTDWMYGSQAKFLCDSTLGRLCRWMRALGIDVAIDRVDGQSRMSTKDFKEFFDRAKKENRIILTTSRNMRERATCPRSTYVNTKSMEDALVSICKEYSIKLDRERLLTVCGKCGGEIESCSYHDQRFVGKHIPLDRPVFICIECSQPYWWNDREDSSPARAMKVADRLYEYITMKLNDVSISSASEDLSNNVIKYPSDSVNNQDIAEVNCEKTGESDEESSDENDKLKEVQGREKIDALFELRKEGFTRKSQQLIVTDVSTLSENELVTSSNQPVNTDEDTLNSNEKKQVMKLWQFRSVFDVTNGCEPECTNWSGDFLGTLDYIFVSSDWNIISASCYPHIENVDESISTVTDETKDKIETSLSFNATTTFEDRLSSLMIQESQPSDVWPSDHFMLLSVLEL